MIDTLHLSLLVTAALGTWMARSRILAAVICLLVFPLSAVVLQLYAAPRHAAAIGALDHADACRRTSLGERARPAGDRAKAAEDGAPDNNVQTSCASDSENTFLQTVFVIGLTNYLTIAVGLVTGLLIQERPRVPR